MTEADKIRQVLTWIGFSSHIAHDDIISDAITFYDDILCLIIKDMTALASDFGRRLVANDHVLFGSCRTKKLQSVSFRVKDFYRISEVLTTAGLDRASFTMQLEQARAREDFRLEIVS